jgi:hypothetical protein
MAIRYRVTLTSEERVKTLTKNGKHESRTALFAMAIPLCDNGQADPPWTTANINQGLEMSSKTIERMKKLFVEDALDQAMERKVLDRSTRAVKFDDAFEARITALARSEAPEGRLRWTVRLLAEKAVELDIVDVVFPMTIYRLVIPISG